MPPLPDVAEAQADDGEHDGRGDDAEDGIVLPLPI